MLCHAATVPVKWSSSHSPASNVTSLFNSAQVAGSVTRTLQNSADSKVLATALLVLRDLHQRPAGCLTSDALLPGLVHSLLSCADSASVEVQLATLNAALPGVSTAAVTGIISGLHKAPFPSIQ